MSDHENLGSPYRSQLAACNDHYHAVRSINKYGPIAHTHALAQVFMTQKMADDEWQALEMARVSLDQTRRLAAGELLNKQAHAVLNAHSARHAAGEDCAAPAGFLPA